MDFRKRFTRRNIPKLCIGKSSLDRLAFRPDIYNFRHGIGIKAIIARKKSLMPFRRFRMLQTISAIDLMPTQDPTLACTYLADMGEKRPQRPGRFELLLILCLLAISIFSLSQVAMSGFAFISKKYLILKVLGLARFANVSSSFYMFEKWV
ncbi:uncharacterized protein LOC111066241 [Drosophila obscura]|uniref:uncharacterized protein LOC111066241 n=1 Tax=Drosophila obscura TaxID=7282 RepID=UPI000BA05B59|nr:uncharacterized protein LOC111066241 [Drosophila obscura]